MSHIDAEEMDSSHKTVETDTPPLDYKLVLSVDNKEVNVSKGFLLSSGLLSGATGNGETKVVPVPYVSARMIHYLVKFLRPYESTPSYDPPRRLGAHTQRLPKDHRDIQFFDTLSEADRYEVMAAADFLNIPRIIDAFAWWISYQLEELPPSAVPFSLGLTLAPGYSRESAQRAYEEQLREREKNLKDQRTIHLDWDKWDDLNEKNAIGK